MKVNDNVVNVITIIVLNDHNIISSKIISSPTTKTNNKYINTPQRTSSFGEIIIVIIILILILILIIIIIIIIIFIITI